MTEKAPALDGLEKPARLLTLMGALKQVLPGATRADA